MPMPVLARLQLALISGWLVCQSAAAQENDSIPSDIEWQTVQEYFTHDPPAQLTFFGQGAPRVNSFLNYTHISTDFGFHGPAAYEVVWRQNIIRANLRQQPDAWAGMWHCLAGLARESNRTLNFTAPFAPWIEAAHQPRIQAFQVIASGFGVLKLEIQGADQAVLWSHHLPLNHRSFQPYTLPLVADQLQTSKFLNWTAEPGSDISVNRLSLGLQMPEAGLDQYAFLASYAKLSRSFEGSLGLIRDRAHTESGAFDSVPTSGLFALATAAAATPEAGLVSLSSARGLLRQIHANVSALKAPFGVLPHFLRHTGGRYHVHQGTEYSTVDTAIYYHAMLLAASMLEEDNIASELLASIRRIQFPRLILPDGSISHGMHTDGASLISNGWNDWGGETMLVLLLRHLADPSADPLPLTISHPGRPFLGTGFIAELQSLFYPDFDSDKPDAVSKTPWHSARQNHLSEQRNYSSKHWRGTLTHELGLYGLSAGENATGTAYQVNGTSIPFCNLVHPHYFLMSACLRDRPQEILGIIDSLRRVGFFPPFGLVENVTSTGSSYLPMNSSLNAGFEALAAYHFLCRIRKQPDRIFEASLKNPEIRRAMSHLMPSTHSAKEG